MQWLRLIFRSTRRLVGTDLDGNKYYEVLREGSKPKREVVTSKRVKHKEYVAGIIPVEWEAWLRGSVKDPPSHNDLAKKQRQQLLLSRRVSEINRRDKERQEHEYADGLVSRPLGHAASHSYGYHKESSGPQTIGKHFQPGVWDKQKLKTEPDEENHEGYEPESWKPP